jgi:hypothetical protein
MMKFANILSLLVKIQTVLKNQNKAIYYIFHKVIYVKRLAK